MQGPQGSPGYNPYSKHPDFAGIVQQFMQNMMMKKQMEQGQQQQMWQRGMEEQKMASTEAYRQAQMEAMQQPPKPQALPAIVWEAATATKQAGKPREEWDWGAMGDYMTKKRDKTPTPSTYSLRKADLDKALKAEDITKDQYNKSLFNLKQGMTEEEKRQKGDVARGRNTKEIKDFLLGIPDLVENNQIKVKELRNIIKQQKGVPTSQQGYRLDMPMKYNVAVLNKKDGWETPEDLDIIAKYEAMFKVFKDDLLAKGINTFEKFMTSFETQDLRRHPDFDKNQIKRWYDIYKR